MEKCYDVFPERRQEFLILAYIRVPILDGLYLLPGPSLTHESEPSLSEQSLLSTNELKQYLELEIEKVF